MKAILERNVPYGAEGWDGAYTWGPDYRVRRHSSRPSWLVIQDLGFAENTWEFRTLSEVREFLGGREG